MTIYDLGLDAVECANKFKIDFKKRDMKIGNRYLIKGGTYDGSLGIEPMNMSETIRQIENLYELYVNSMPSERSEDNRHQYFSAPKADEMELEAMVFGEPREVARYKLEAFVLMSILNGNFNNEWGAYWFWQSPKYRDLIILKEWVM